MNAADDALIDELRAHAQLEPRRPMWDGDRPALRPPAPPEAIAAAETALGFGLPTLLRRIYTEVADGGIGPAYGLFPIASRYTEAGQDETVVDVRTKLAVDSRWPSKLVPICDWGCANWSCLDCRTEDGPVVILAGEEGFFDTGRDLSSWLAAWMSGVDLWDEMFEPRTTMGINPFTRKPIEIKLGVTSIGMGAKQESRSYPLCASGVP